MPFKDLCLALALYPIYVSLCESPVLRWKCFILLVTCQLEILSFDLNEGYSCSLRFLLTHSHVRARSLSHTHTRVCLPYPIDGPGFRFSMQSYDYFCILCVTLGFLISLLQLKSLFKEIIEIGVCIACTVACTDDSLKDSKSV